jgi:hypothetical protein
MPLPVLSWPRKYTSSWPVDFNATANFSSFALWSRLRLKSLCTSCLHLRTRGPGSLSGDWRFAGFSFAPGGVPLFRDL